MIYLKVLDLKISRSSRSKQLLETISTRLDSIFVEITDPSVDLAHACSTLEIIFSQIKVPCRLTSGGIPKVSPDTVAHQTIK